MRRLWLVSTTREGIPLRAPRSQENRRPTAAILVLVVALPLVAACGPTNFFSVYRMEIQQGNFISQEAVSQLKSGMTKDQVRFVLGTPLVADIFHEDRWDYVFMRRRQNASQTEERRVSVFFEDGKLARVEGDVVPGQVDAGNAPAPVPAGGK